MCIELQFKVVDTPLDLRRSKYNWEPLDEAISNGTAIQVEVPEKLTPKSFRIIVAGRYKKRNIKVHMKSIDVRSFIVWPSAEAVEGEVVDDQV